MMDQRSLVSLWTIVVQSILDWKMPVNEGATNSAKMRGRCGRTRSSRSFSQISVIRAVGVKKKILDWTLQLNNGKARP